MDYFQGEFVDDGTETHFEWGKHTCYIKAISSGKKKDGIIHSLIIDGNEIPEAADEWTVYMEVSRAVNFICLEKLVISLF